MAVFGLLHGAFEGAWVWEFLTPELRQLGHDAIAVDLPIDDIGGVREVTVLVGVGAVQAKLADRAGVDVERRGRARQGHEYQRAAGTCHRHGLIEHARRRGRDELRVQAFPGRRR